MDGTDCQDSALKKFLQPPFATSKNSSRSVVRSIFFVLRHPLTASLHLPKGSASASRPPTALAGNRRGNAEVNRRVIGSTK